MSGSEAVAVSDSDEDDCFRRPNPNPFRKLTTGAAGGTPRAPQPTNNTLTPKESGAVESACKAARTVLAEAAKAAQVRQ